MNPEKPSRNENIEKENKDKRSQKIGKKALLEYGKKSLAPILAIALLGIASSRNSQIYDSSTIKSRTEAHDRAIANKNHDSSIISLSEDHERAVNIEHCTLNAEHFCAKAKYFLSPERKYPLNGESPEEKIWNFLYYRIGCSDVQAAGIMGNIAVESPSYNPFQYQVSNATKTWSNKKIIDNTDIGVGLFQFSRGRKTKFLNFAEEYYPSTYQKLYDPSSYSKNNFTYPTNISDEDFDNGVFCTIAYVVYEMEKDGDANYSRSQWNKFCNSKNDAAAMANGFRKYFERTGNKKEERKENAKAIYDKYVRGSEPLA